VRLLLKILDLKSIASFVFAFLVLLAYRRSAQVMLQNRVSVRGQRLVPFSLRGAEVLLLLPLVGNPVVLRFDTSFAADHGLVLPCRRRGRNRQSASAGSGASIGPVAAGGLRLVLVDDAVVGIVAMIDPRT